MYHDSEKHAHAWPLLQMAAAFRLGYGTAQRRKRHNMARRSILHRSTVLGQLVSASLASECRQDLRINLE
jgi:hypothetical protein